MNVTAGNFGTVILEGRTANDKYAEARFESDSRCG